MFVLDTLDLWDIAFSCLNWDYSNRSLLVFQVKIYFRSKLHVSLSNFFPVLTLGLDKQQEKKSV